ncbi:MAG: nicotinate phosphoribosyltransferase [Alphaproteobacteria bacterium]
MFPDVDAIPRFTDSYFIKTRRIIERFGESVVTYALFMRRPVIFAPRLMTEWLQSIAKARGIEIRIDYNYAEGDWVGAGEPLLYITGPFSKIVDLETLYLQKLGATCVAAYNAHSMCSDLPNAAFIAMDARHCAGTEMAEMMAYAAAVGSTAARRLSGAVGYVGNAVDAHAHFFGNQRGLGTMPHALIGYAGSTVRAAEMYVEMFADEDLVVLVDYYGQEVTDAIAVARRYPDHAASGRLAIRIDTHGGRYVEGLDMPRSYEVLERHAPSAIRGYRNEMELRFLIGTGVSAAALFHVRDELDRVGLGKVRIIASSGFGPAKCRVMGEVKAPIDVVGSGSHVPDSWHETYATADIVEYDGKPMVKVGREFLLKRRHGALT